MFVFNQDGFTALMTAAKEGHHDCLSILLAHGAKVNIAREVSVVAIRLECMRMNMIRFISVVHYCGLLWAGFGHKCFDYHASCIDQGDSTALMLAAENGHHECLSILLAHGAFVDLPNNVSVKCACSYGRTTWYGLDTMDSRRLGCRYMYFDQHCFTAFSVC